MARATASWTGNTRDDGEPGGPVAGWAGALARLVADVAAAEHEDEVLQRLAEGLPGLLGADRASVTLLDERGQSYRVLALAGEGGAFPVGDVRPLAGSVVEATLRTDGALLWSADGAAYTDSHVPRDVGLVEGANIALAVDGVPIGTLDVASREPGRLGPVEAELLAHVGAVVSSCLSRLRQLQRIESDLVRERRRASSLRTLNDIGEILQGALSEDEVVELVARDLPRVVVADRIGYARLASDGTSATVGAVGDSDLPFDDREVPVRGTAIGRVFASGGVLLVDDLEASEWDDARALARAGYASAALLPLAAGGRTVGVVVAAARAPQSYASELRVILSTFSRLAGATLERAWEHARRDRIEANLHQSRKLESLGVLAGGIAHDFNNLLQGVLGNASLALADLPPGSPARFPVRQIEAAAQHAATLTSQLLAYAGRRQLRTETVDVARLVSETGELVRSAAGEGTQVTLDVPGAPCIAVVDPAQVRQLVLSLVANAGEALGGGEGTVRVTVAEADESNTPRHDAVGRSVELAEGVVIVVEDDGVGMTPETIARAFEPFFTTKFAGRGLGLPWAMGVAHGHGGAIAIESRPGVGTRVVVFLPRASVPVRRVPDRPGGDAVDGRRSVVLVVDDNESVVALAARILDREGYDVLAATDGTAALELFSQHGSTLAAVVLDVTMPGMSGDELFLELVEHGLQAPVIVSSGFAEEEAMRKFDAAAVAGFLQKPYRAQELVEILRGAVRNRG